eukprot:353643-Chlamydomonas_euryale.AAC.5
MRAGRAPRRGPARRERRLGGGEQRSGELPCPPAGTGPETACMLPAASGPCPAAAPHRATARGTRRGECTVADVA